jgi:long-chain fatty acid transport protein
MNRLRIRRIVRVLSAAAFVLAVFGGTAWAGGISLYEFGSPDVGLAAAGYAARAQDASTVFTNPAGMSHLDASQVMAGRPFTAA